MWFIWAFFLLRNKTCVSYNLRFLFLNKNYNNFDRVFAIQVQTNKLNNHKKLFIYRSQAMSNSSIIKHIHHFWCYFKPHWLLLLSAGNSPFSAIWNYGWPCPRCRCDLSDITWDTRPTHDRRFVSGFERQKSQTRWKLNANDVTAEENTLLWSNFFLSIFVLLSEAEVKII